MNSKNHLTGTIEFVTNNFIEDDDFTTDTRSGFVHGNYHVTEKLSLSAGLRYAITEKTAKLDHPPLFNETIPFGVKANRTDWLARAQLHVHRRHHGLPRRWRQDRVLPASPRSSTPSISSLSIRRKR